MLFVFNTLWRLIAQFTKAEMNQSRAENFVTLRTKRQVVDLVLAAANRRLCKDGAVKPRVAMERLRCLAQYCEMLQLDDAASNYRRYIAEWVRTCDARGAEHEDRSIIVACFRLQLPHSLGHLLIIDLQ